MLSIPLSLRRVGRRDQTAKSFTRQHITALRGRNLLPRAHLELFQCPRQDRDDNSGVLGPVSQALRGPYAAGEVAGGVHGNNQSVGRRCASGLRWVRYCKRNMCQVHFGR